MNKALIDAVAEKLKDYPLYSQENTDGNPLILAKLTNSMGRGNWWLTEFNPGDLLAFGYASIFGDHNDEWGYMSLEELASLKIAGLYCIDLVADFTPTRFNDLTDLPSRR